MKTSIFQNSNKNIVRISALKLFLFSWRFPDFPGGFLEAFWGFLGTKQVHNIMNKETYRKPQGSYKTFQGKIHFSFSYGLRFLNFSDIFFQKWKYLFISEKSQYFSLLKHRYNLICMPSGIFF